MILNYFDFETCKESSVEIFFSDKILSLRPVSGASQGVLLPGLIDAHVHIESSMLSPSGFSRLSVRNGVIAVVTDPHEIANVLGVDGVSFMMENAKDALMKIFFGVPSCVPATSFETSGAVIGSKEVEILLKRDNVVVLSEMMNFPGVVYNDQDVFAKIDIAKKFNIPIDGHAPGLSGADLDKYIDAGISTDHEAYSYDEALEKINKGMMIQIREGSAAKNFDALYKLIDEYPNSVMLCSDDSHPDDLQNGYINNLIKRGLDYGISFKNLYKAAFFNPIKHYGLKSVGQLRVGDPADFIIVDNLKDFNILQTYVNGKKVYDKNESLIKKDKNDIDKIVLNNFNAQKISSNDISVSSDGGVLNVIKAFNGELITDIEKITVKKGILNTNQQEDLLKIIVLNRYKKSKPSVAFIQGFGLKNCAIASTIAHDSHNIIAVGTDDNLIVNAVNKLIELKGGIVVADRKGIDFLQLEIAGLMTYQNEDFVANKYSELNERVKNSGTLLDAPFITLSFMALLVIPKLKISDKGLFDGEKFQFINLVE